MAKIEIYTGSFCPYCNIAEQLLKQLGQSDNIEEINKDPTTFAEMQQISRQRTMPQIFIGKTHIGDFTDMYTLHQKGKL